MKHSNIFAIVQKLRAAARDVIPRDDTFEMKGARAWVNKASEEVINAKSAAHACQIIERWYEFSASPDRPAEQHRQRFYLQEVLSRLY